MRLVVLAALVACSSKPAPAPTNRSATPPPPPAVAPFTSPGPLAKGHDAISGVGQCNECHVDSSPKLSVDKCLGCHDHRKLSQRIAAGRGFHASAVVKGKPCELCHLDHKGGSFDLTGWQSMKGGMKGFNHDLAGWPLRGKHAQTSCDQCHKTRNKQGLATFVGTSSACVDCHAQDQPHQLDLARGACNRCHSEAAWKPTLRVLAFDHDNRRDARVAITSAHANVACVKCHPTAVFTSTRPDPGACEHCHAAKSPHGARFDAFGKPPACATCHVASWRPTAFDHTKHTKFPLHHHHAATCRDCHRGTKPVFEKLDATQSTCGGCHRHTSGAIHDGKYTHAECVQCHNRSVPPRPSLLVTAVHGLNGVFPLVGGHKMVACADCHKTRKPGGATVFSDLSPQCSKCHQDSHLGRRGTKCVDCHVSGSWNIRPKSSP